MRSWRDRPILALTATACQIDPELEQVLGDEPPSSMHIGPEPVHPLYTQNIFFLGFTDLFGKSRESCACAVCAGQSYGWGTFVTISRLME